MQLAPPVGFRGAFRTDEDARAVYSEAAGIGRTMPAAVVVPVDANDVALVVRWAWNGGHSLIPRGSGSSMPGGAIGSGVVLDLSRLRGVGDPDVSGRWLRSDAGVLRGEVDRKAAAVGLRFPVDPSSGEFCTIGGMAATNAAGPHSLKHGSTRVWVLALECVFDDGTRAIVRRGEAAPVSVPAIARFMRDVHPALLATTPPRHAGVVKESSGYALATYAQTQELVDLLVGTEGTLAVFTSVELGLMPAPNSSASLLVSFRDLQGAVEAAVVAREHGAAACELLDRTFIGIAQRASAPLPVSADAEAALLIEVEAPDSGQAVHAIDQLRQLFRTMAVEDSVVASGAQHEAELWSFRHAASPAIARMDPAFRSMQFIEDAAVPPASLAAYVRGVRRILERADTPGVIFGHAGDAHVHINPLVDVNRSDWRRRLGTILLEVTDLVASLAGTLTGEHGDGRLRTPLLDRVWSREALAQFAATKQAFDPAGVFNPGVKIPLSGQQAIDVVKYDPLARALPEGVRRALARVERERAYSRFRLDLL